MKSKVKNKEGFTNEKAGFYKGYDIRWLKEIGEQHPDFYLVAELEAKKVEK